MDLPADVQNCLRVDAAYWADYSQIRLANGKIFSFKDRTYQIKPMQSRARKICVRKARGLGFSEIYILRSLHGCIYGIYSQGVAYFFPNETEMQKFSKSRFGPLLLSNKDAIGKFAKGGGRTDSANLKRIGNSNLFMEGAMMTVNVGEDINQKESAAIRGKQYDSVILDEIDLMDRDILQKVEGGMGNSNLKEVVCISNPTIPNYGIDALFQQSNQLYWYGKCSCGKLTCSDREFPNFVREYPNREERIRQRQHLGFCACHQCGKELSFEGEWIPDYPKNEEWEGYSISQLNTVTNDPWEILSQFENPPNDNIEDVYKFRLGLPYISKEDHLNVQDVYSCCGNKLMQSYHAGPCAMGVDVGKTFHVVIGVRTDKNRFELIKAARLGSFDDVGLLAQRFGVKSAVIDIRPYEDSARKFQKDFKGGLVYLCEYTTNPMQEAFWDNNKKTVKAYRTGIFDATHKLISEKRLTIPRRCPEMDEFAKQICATAKILETSKKTGSQVYTYIKLGEEHYRNALNYFLLAAQGTRVKTVDAYKSDKQEYAFHQTTAI